MLCRGDLSSYKQDSIWSWFICFCTTICMVLSVGFTFALGVLFPVLMNYFDENREKTAWVSSIIIGVFCFLGPISSSILNRFGMRVTTILGCLSCAVGLALGSFTPNIIILYVAFSLPFAIGVSAIYVVSPIIVFQYFIQRRSFALGIVTAGQGLGTMILGPALQALVDIFGWKNSFRLFAGILAFASLTGVILHRKSTRLETDERQEARRKKPPRNLSLLRDPIIFMIVLRNGLTTFARLVPYVHIVGFMADKFGNYFAAFLMAGGVAIVASLVPFLLVCVKQDQKENFDDDVEETVHPGQIEDADNTELKSRGFSHDSAISVIGRDRLRRSSSFALALDSPIF
ncbi:monocarboxylate transporter 11-like [Stylophora pistillata]|uniref:Monocarboxylate transporter 12 n=1 Tax=Stylophora pistillata TaxID=50429 RepID=A0A2B4S8H0_STYPI|nr:monocarboxylate transporter 11-like [Stylophora pistillata]PFX26191.1 Monocarboxylate transporter 12 [Stylophora pistillata]